MKCKHNWSIVGYFDNGFGVSTSCAVKWCNKCGSLLKNKTKNPLNIKKISSLIKENYASGYKAGYEEAEKQAADKSKVFEYPGCRMDLW